MRLSSFRFQPQVGDATPAHGPAQGLVNGPLNDLTGRGLWAFNQAYLYAGLIEFADTAQIKAMIA